MTDKEILTIKRGDTLLLMHDDRKRIEIVTKVTPTQIITERGRYYRTKGGGRKVPGYSVGFLNYHIERIATKKDIAAKQREEQKRDSEREQRELEQKVRRNKLWELSDLFPHGVCVDYYQHHEPGTPETFDITNLNETQVRFIADALKK